MQQLIKMKVVSLQTPKSEFQVCNVNIYLFLNLTTILTTTAYIYRLTKTDSGNLNRNVDEVLQKASQNTSV